MSRAPFTTSAGQPNAGSCASPCSACAELLQATVDVARPNRRKRSSLRAASLSLSSAGTGSRKQGWRLGQISRSGSNPWSLRVSRLHSVRVRLVHGTPRPFPSVPKPYRNLPAQPCEQISCLCEAVIGSGQAIGLTKPPASSGIYTRSIS
jgi:hypothetical protein